MVIKKGDFFSALTKEGRYDVTLTTANAIGSNQAYKAECLQVGSEMMIWNITEQEIDNLKPISYDSFGFYAGSNMFGLDRFAEKYPAPLADATVKTVDAYFASTKTREPDAAIELAIYDMAADGGPGKVLAKTSLKASELKSNASEYVQTTFEFAEPVAIAKGKPFFVAIGPFPYEGTEKPPLFPFYRRGQTSLSGVYEAFWLRCVVRVKSKNRPREGLGTLPNGFLGDVLADM